MDPIQFAALMENLVLEEEEGVELLEITEDEFGEVEGELECQVACKIPSEVQSSPDVFKKLIPRIWNVEGKLEIESVGGNVYICTFENKVNKEQVVAASPWIYDNAVILFEDMSGGKSASEMEFGTGVFWVRIHDVPPICHTEGMAKKLGLRMGGFIAWDREGGKRNKGKFLRLKAAVDVRRPLKRALKVKCGVMAPERWVRLSYERCSSNSRRISQREKRRPPEEFSFSIV